MHSRMSILNSSASTLFSLNDSIFRLNSRYITRVCYNCYFNTLSDEQVETKSDSDDRLFTVPKSIPGFQQRNKAIVLFGDFLYLTLVRLVTIVIHVNKRR